MNKKRHIPTPERKVTRFKQGDNENKKYNAYGLTTNISFLRLARVLLDEAEDARSLSAECLDAYKKWQEINADILPEEMLGHTPIDKLDPEYLGEVFKHSGTIALQLAKIMPGNVIDQMRSSSVS